jgi:prepilin-type N-terminal cleavage/methylation domain-containing protein
MTASTINFIPRPSAAGPRARFGFTLVEILIVIVILGIVSAVIVPQIGNRDDLRGAAAARIVMSDLIYAQNLGISRQQTHYVRFGANTYSIYTVPTGGTPITHPVNKSPYTVNFGSTGSNGLTSTVVTSRSFDGQATLAFDELGTPYSYNSTTTAFTPLANDGTIVLTTGSYALTISVEPFTGEISVAAN